MELTQSQKLDSSFVVWFWILFLATVIFAFDLEMVVGAGGFSIFYFVYIIKGLFQNTTLTEIMYYLTSVYYYIYIYFGIFENPDWRRVLTRFFLVFKENIPTSCASHTRKLAMAYSILLGANILVHFIVMIKILVSGVPNSFQPEIMYFISPRNSYMSGLKSKCTISSIKSSCKF